MTEMITRKVNDYNQFSSFNEQLTYAYVDGLKREVIRLGQALAKRDQKIEKLYKRVKGLRKALRQSQVAIKFRNEQNEKLLNAVSPMVNYPVVYCTPSYIINDTGPDASAPYHSQVSSES